MRHLLGELSLRRTGPLLAAVAVLATGCGSGDDGSTSADCAMLVRLDGVVYAEAGSGDRAGAPEVGDVLGTGDLSSCNGTDAEGIVAGPYFAEDPPPVQVLAVQGIDPSVAVAVRDDGSVRFLVDPEAPPAQVDAAMTSLGAG